MSEHRANAIAVILRAISEHHSGNAAEGYRIAEAAYDAMHPPTPAVDPNIHREDAKLAGTMNATILAMIQESGDWGVGSGTLRAVCARYGARIHDLRKAGHNIRTMRAGPCRYRYVLVLP